MSRVFSLLMFRLMFKREYGIVGPIGIHSDQLPFCYRFPKIRANIRIIIARIAVGKKQRNMLLGGKSIFLL